MVEPRRSTRQAAKFSASPSSSQSKPEAATGGTKRKADSKSAPKVKRGKKGDEKEQATIEDTMLSKENNGDNDDLEMKDEERSKPAETSNGVDEVAKREEDIRDQEDMREPPGNSKKDSEEELKKNGFDVIMCQGKDEDKNVTEEGTGSKVSAADNAVEDSSERAEAEPSNILEKGIIYFFFRVRVGINEPSDVNDIARSYIILRPMPPGSKLGDGPIGDVGNVRMLSLPKKVLPISPKDRFMTFVEKANASMEDGR